MDVDTEECTCSCQLGELYVHLVESKHRYSDEINVSRICLLI